jgi:RNA polymerase sigma factor (sigma-70 family)
MNDVVAAQQGDPLAFGRLVDRWKSTVSSIALSIVRDVAESHDVAQEVFLTAWTKITALDNPASFGPWIRQITRNTALTTYRSRQRREQRVVSDEEGVASAVVEDPHLEREEQRLVQEALDALPDEARDVMILFYREGQSVRQVAELLELSEAAVKKRLSRARALVRADVQDRLSTVLVRTAPGAAFTAAILVGLAPAPAVAASTALTTGASVSSGFLAGLTLTSVLAVVFGYKLAERVTEPGRLPLLHRARNLTLLGVCTTMGGALLGPWPGLIGLLVFIGLLTYVQFGLLPEAFGRQETKAATVGRFFGVIGLLTGTTCGLLGATHGMGWW